LEGRGREDIGELKIQGKMVKFFTFFKSAVMFMINIFLILRIL